MSTPTTRSIAHALIAAAIVAASPSAAPAAFSDAALTCRAAISRGGSKLATTAYKTVATCHKQRDRDAGAAGTDCNDISQAGAVKQQVAGAVAKLASSVGGASDRCAGLIPADLGYYNCPAPCDVEVPALTTFSDVADCVSCVVQEQVSTITTDALGSPVPALDAADGKCHSALSKTQGKQFGAVLKTRNKCQDNAEKRGGVEDLSSCTGGADTAGDAKIGTGRAKAEASIASACQPADRGNLDTCDPTLISGLQACVLGSAESAGETVFEALRTLDTAAPTTTTTTTTTTLPPATWTGVQSLLAARCAGSCHTGSSVSGGLGGLDDYDAGYTNLVNANTACGGSLAKRVLPGDSASSFMMHKLDWTQDCGSTMPFGGAKLPAGERDVIRAWIDAGALKN
ncbi:MAG: hypothetical protein HY899_08215 [Deltaproteobacteria bacterium]|nr:hypothetical protein [Deltaproteobacteria bacterium]